MLNLYLLGNTFMWGNQHEFLILNLYFSLSKPIIQHIFHSFFHFITFFNFSDDVKNKELSYICIN